MTLSRFTRSLAALAAVAGLAAFAVGSAMAADVDVAIVKLAFEPKDVTANVGDTVTWTVTDAVPEGHTVTSGAPEDADQGALFDSGVGLKANGETFEFTFEEAGTFAYFCQIHGAAMSGTITVAEAGASGQPASGPPASGPATSGEPGSEPPGSEPPGAEAPGGEPTQVPAERRLLAGGVLLVAIVIMFAGAAVWRRLNPA